MTDAGLRISTGRHLIFGLVDSWYRAKEQGDVEEIVFCREELLEALLWTVYMYLTKKIVRNELESSILAWNNLLLNE